MLRRLWRLSHPITPIAPVWSPKHLVPAASDDNDMFLYHSFDIFPLNCSPVPFLSFAGQNNLEWSFNVLKWIQNKGCLIFSPPFWAVLSQLSCLEAGAYFPNLMQITPSSWFSVWTSAFGKITLKETCKDMFGLLSLLYLSLSLSCPCVHCLSLDSALTAWPRPLWPPLPDKEFFSAHIMSHSVTARYTGEKQQPGPEHAGCG